MISFPKCRQRLLRSSDRLIKKSRCCIISNITDLSSHPVISTMLSFITDLFPTVYADEKHEEAPVEEEEAAPAATPAPAAEEEEEPEDDKPEIEEGKRKSGVFNQICPRVGKTLCITILSVCCHARRLSRPASGMGRDLDLDWIPEAERRKTGFKCKGHRLRDSPKTHIQGTFNADAAFNICCHGTVQGHILILPRVPTSSLPQHPVFRARLIVSSSGTGVPPPQSL